LSFHRGRAAICPDFTGKSRRVKEFLFAWHHNCLHKKTVVVRISIFLSCLFAVASLEAAGLSQSETRFVYVDRHGKVQSTEIISHYTGKLKNISFPNLDPRLARAATIAEERARAHSHMRCWRYVKQALLAAGAVDSYPKTELARQAGRELVEHYGFTKLAVHDPYQAPVGSVLVYGSRRGAGHVEIRTRRGFVSDFRASEPSKRPLIGVYAKVDSSSTRR
jgi:hypothetical protein